MTVKRVSDWTTLKAEEYIGLSTDTKPIVGEDLNTLSAGAGFYELDTKNVYIFDGMKTWYLM